MDSHKPIKIFGFDALTKKEFESLSSEIRVCLAILGEQVSGKEIKPKPRKKTTRKWKKTEKELKAAKLITAMIVDNHKTLSEKLNDSKNMQKAAQAIDDCTQKHGYDRFRVFKICEWVCKHDFWKKQFQSVMKLTRNDNGSTGVRLKWIQRFENEMKKSSFKSVDEISESFNFKGVN